MGNEVTIIIKAIDKASAEFKKVEGASAQLGNAMKGLGIAAAGVTAAVGAGVAAWKAVVAPVIDYNKAILDAARSTRMGTEDLSRFVQVGDDMGVGIDSITRALQMATKNGFAPSITAIADLADKANAMNTPTERAATLAKMFGRNWAELDPILQLGGQRIRELAASQADGLVATEAEIEKSEELRLKIDAVSDSFRAQANEIGLKLIPIITDYLDLVNQQADVSETLRRAGELGIATYGEQSLALTKMAQGDMTYVQAIEAEIAAHDANNAAMMRALGPTELFRASIGGLGLAAKGAFPRVQAITQEMLDAAMQASNGQQQVDLLATAIASLRDKSITIDITTINREIDIMMNNAPTSWYTPAKPESGPSGWKKDYPGGWIQGGHIWTARGDTGRTPYAQGGDFIVPPGFSNDSYPMAVQSGEHVQITPAGEKSKSGANVTINVTSSPLDTQYMTQAIKRAVGM